MRGCLSFFVFAAVLLATMAWFGVPPAADWLVTQVVCGSISGDVNAHVTADPPPRLLLLHADSLQIDGTGVTLPGGSISAAALSLTLTDVNLLSRHANQVTGRLDEVTVVGAGLAGAPLPIRSIRLSGPPDSLAAVATVDGSTAVAIAGAEVSRLTGAPSAYVSLVAPDSLSIAVAGQVTLAQLMVVQGSLVAQPSSGTIGAITIVAGASLGLLRLASVQVTGSSVILTGQLDRAALAF